MRIRRQQPSAIANEAFVDTDAWVALALALTRDPLHDRARAVWIANEVAGTRWTISVPVVIESF